LATFCESTIVNSTDETTATTMLEQSRKHKATRVEDFCCWFIITKMDKIARMFALQPDFVGSVLAKVATEPPVQPPLDSVPALGSSSRTKVKDEYGAPPSVSPAQMAKMNKQATSPTSGTIATDRKKRSPNDNAAYTPPPPVAAQYAAQPKRPGPYQSPQQQGPTDQLTGRNLEAAKKVIKSLKADLDAPAFNVPVDPVALLIPDYPYIIKQPMDLGTVGKKLNQKQYRTFRDWAADVRQIWDNARVYNRPESVIAMQADRLSQLFEAQYNTVKQEAGLPVDYDPLQRKTHEFYMAIYQKGAAEYQRVAGVTLTPQTGPGPGPVGAVPPPVGGQPPRPPMPRPPAPGMAQQQYAPVPPSAGAAKAQKPKPAKRKADEMTPTPMMHSPHVQNGGPMGRPQPNPYAPQQAHPMHQQHMGMPPMGHHGHPGAPHMGHPGMPPQPQPTAMAAAAPFPPEELEFLSAQLNNLNEDQVQHVIEIMQLAPNADGEYEINITDLPPATLRRLQQFVYAELKIPEKRFKPNEAPGMPQW
jgi:hypothetical protein